MGRTTLHYEGIGPEAAPQTAVILHGILGSGRNFRGFARKLAERAPNTRFLLVDLPHHGDSPQTPGPHSLEKIASEVFQLCDALGLRTTALIGHSFGGKVAMVMARDRPERCRALFVLDSNPGFQHVSFERPHDHEVLRVLHHLRRESGPFADKNEASHRLMEDGLSERIARWVVLNLDGPPGQLRWRLDLDAITEMLRAYFETNLWPLIEQPTPFPKSIVIGGRSDRHSTGNTERLESCAKNGTIELHVLEKAGHWLHVDDPEGLIEWLAPRLEAR